MAAHRPALSDLLTRQALARTAALAAKSGLTPQMSGNLSARSGTGFLITPSGLAFEGLRPAQLTQIGVYGVAKGKLKPSSEWLMHHAIYAARPDVLAIVHTHSPFATAMACVHREIPPFHYMVAVTGADRVPVAKYATFGTDTLAKNVVTALGQGYACLIANHGAIAAGRSLEHAYRIAWEVETLAAQYSRAVALGVPRLLDRAEMQRVVARFQDYGQAEASE
jgi:L-fuculose-phosphate aldolase